MKSPAARETSADRGRLRPTWSEESDVQLCLHCCVVRDFLGVVLEMHVSGQCSS